MAESLRYDVYISTSGDYENDVRILASELQEKGIRIWYTGLLKPGEVVKDETERALQQSRLALVIIGEKGLSTAQTHEITLIARRVIEQDYAYPVIPVLLYGARPSELPEFLASRQAIVFPKGSGDPKLLNQLIGVIRNYLDREVTPEVTSPDDSKSHSDRSAELTISQLLDSPVVKRLRPDERRALRDAASYCASKTLPLTSVWLLGAMLHDPRPEGTEEFVVRYLQKHASFRSGSLLELPPDFYDFLTAAPRPYSSAKILMARELDTTLTIAASIANAVKNNQRSNESIHTRHILAAILSNEMQRLSEHDVSTYPFSATKLLEQTVDLNDLRWKFLSYLRVNEKKTESAMELQMRRHLTWLGFVSPVPPDDLWKNLLSAELQLFSEEASPDKGVESLDDLSRRTKLSGFVLLSQTTLGKVLPGHEIAAQYLGLFDPKSTKFRLKLMLSLPVGLTSLNRQLRTLSIIHDDVNLNEPDLTQAKKEDLWRAILLLNPEHLGTLNEALKTKSPGKRAENPHSADPPKSNGDTKAGVESTRKIAPPVSAPTDLPGPSTEITYTPPQPVPPAPPPIINVTTVLPTPAPAKNKVSLQVSTDLVVLWYDGQFYSGPNLISKELVADETSPEEYGQQLFKAVIHGNGPQSTLSGYKKARQENRDDLVFELWIPEQAVGLNAQKWEYLRDSDDNTLPLFGKEKSPFYRRVHSIFKQPAPAKPLKILVAICNPTTLGKETDDEGNKNNTNVSRLVKLDVAQERAIIEAALRRLEKAGVAEYEILDSSKDQPVTLESIREKLQEGHHILHLLSHGLLLEGNYYLVMEAADRRHKLEPAIRFKEILEAQNDLRLVVLAACQSARRGTGDTLKGLGPAIVGDAIPAVIAMQDEVKIDTAQLFTQYFYDDLARTGRVDTAMAATRFVLYQRKPNDWQWGIPVLFMSTDDGKLLDTDNQVAAKLPALEPNVKSYDQLAGHGDPAPRKLAQAIEAEARHYGAVPETVGALRAVVAPSLAAVRDGDNLLAQPQDRESLTRALTQQLSLEAEKLETFVKENGGKLELDKSVFRQIASALNAGKHVILIGPPGTGKTSLAHAVCQYAESQGCAAGFIPTTATADWTAFDTIGGYVPTAQQILQFRPGKFLEAICSGSWLVIDEINRAEIDKAFGELFTVLSGQRADLPYSVGRDLVRILPASGDDPNNWVPNKGTGLSGYDYVMHPTWRILATMNVYDKSSLFGMSFAFMRRFAFVDVDLPLPKTFEGLVHRWADERKIDRQDKDVDDMLKKLKGLLKPDNALRRRALGPAIVKDMIWYIGNRLPVVLPEKPIDVLGEAFLLYVTPQLDGLDRAGITDIYSYLQDEVFSDSAILEMLKRRLRALYPHMGEREWESSQ